MSLIPARAIKGLCGDRRLLLLWSSYHITIVNHRLVIAPENFNMIVRREIFKQSQKVYLNLLLTETLLKLISKINRSDITTGIPLWTDVRLKPPNKPVSDADHRGKTIGNTHRQRVHTAKN